MTRKQATFAERYGTLPSRTQSKKPNVSNAPKAAEEVPEAGHCAHPKRRGGECGKPLDADQFCFGCRSFVCESHGDAPLGKHRPEDHHEPCRDCGDRVEEAGADCCSRCEG